MSTIGYWSNSFGLSVVPPKKPNNSSSNQQLYGVVWPGKITQKPRGWAFSNNGRKLRVGVPIGMSSPLLVSHIQASDNYVGYCIDVFNAAKELLPYAVQYEFIPFGDGHSDPIIDDLLLKILTVVSMN
jgi:ionotropic glutamate receptor